MCKSVFYRVYADSTVIVVRKREVFIDKFYSSSKCDAVFFILIKQTKAASMSGETGPVRLKRL